MKTIDVPEHILALCAVKAREATALTLDELRALVAWADCQTASLWDNMSLQEILNVYRVSGEWDTWEAWAEQPGPAAYLAWNLAVESPLNVMRVPEAEEDDD